MDRRLSTRGRARRGGRAAPTAAVVAIGDELLAGRTRDTNSGWIATELSRRGFAVTALLVVPDRVEPIVDALRFATGRAAAVVVSGGLGPTVDDRTFEALGRLLRSPLRERPDVVEMIAARLGRPASELEPANRRQASLPARADVLPNRFGTAPGAAALHHGCWIYLLPGVPREMRGLFAEQVMPRLRELAPHAAPPAEAVFRTSGLPEAEVAERLVWLTSELPAEVSFLVAKHGVDVRFPAGVGERRAATARSRRVRRVLAPFVYEEGERSLPEVVVELLRRHATSLAVAESCTGGLLGAALTGVPGASDVFWGGWMTYADTAKQRELGVSERDLARHGAVSVAVGRAMARAARRAARTTWGIGITGVAGPGGGTPAKPVGTVVIAWAGPHSVTHVVTHRFPGDREAIRGASVSAALDGLRRLLTGVAPPGAGAR